MSSRASRPALGRVWTALIVTQVATAVAVLPFALYVVGVSVRHGSSHARYPADAILTASLALQSDEARSAGQGGAEEASLDEYRARAGELLRRLEAEPAFAGVTFASQYPGNERYARIEVEPAAGDPTTRPEETPAPLTVVGRVNQVEPDFFDVFDVPILEGRGFLESDARDASHPVLVDSVFASAVLGGRVAGRRIRRILQITRRTGMPDEIQTGPWLRIVGVVPDFAVRRDFDPGEDARVYQPVAASDAPVPLHLMVRVRSAGPEAARQLRNLASRVDAGLQLGQLRTASQVEEEAEQGLVYVAWAVAAVTSSVLLLSAAGIYAMVSFTVTRRWREIGIRRALGASPRRLLGGIFARASAQLGAGVLAGLVLAALLDRLAGDVLGDRTRLLLPAVAALMVLVGLLAALGPARRGLAVQPTEALRED
jgi:hypothetical protein